MTEDHRVSQVDIVGRNEAQDTEIWMQHFIGGIMAQRDNSQSLSPGLSRVFSFIYKQVLGTSRQ